MRKKLAFIATLCIAVLSNAGSVLADGHEGGSAYLPLGIALTMGLAALGGTLGQSKAIVSGLDAIGRNPSARGDIFLPMIIGLALVESLVILAFVISILLVGKM